MGRNKKIAEKTDANRIKLKYSPYYNVDDVPVVLELKDNEAIGKIAMAGLIRLIRLFEGCRINKNEYFSLSKSFFTG